MNMKKTILWIIVIGLLVAASVFYYLKNIASKHTDPTDVVKINISAPELYRMFSNFEDSANKTYAVRDLAIKVSGVVQNVELNKNRYTVFLSAGEDEMGAVSCEMDSTENDKIKLLKTNDSAHIVGFCTGYLMDVQLFRCKLAK
jgi:hypothetical protein